jgi:hypothetical protein
MYSTIENLAPMALISDDRKLLNFQKPALHHCLNGAEMPDALRLISDWRNAIRDATT